LKVIANANHGVHLEKNEEVIELIKEHALWDLVIYSFHPDCVFVRPHSAFVL
jgi:hypothetical protein